MTGDKNVLNLQNARYKVFSTAKEWMKIFMKGDEAKKMSQSEIVKNVLDDILSGKITPDDIEKLAKEKSKGKVEVKAEEKVKVKKADK